MMKMIHHNVLVYKMMSKYVRYLGESTFCTHCYHLRSSKSKGKQKQARVTFLLLFTWYNSRVKNGTTEANIKFFRCCNIRNDTFLYTFDLDGKYRNNNNIASSSLLLLSFIEGPRILCQSSYMPYLNLWQMFSVCCSFKDDRFIFT